MRRMQPFFGSMMQDLAGKTFVIADRHQAFRAIMRHVLKDMGARSFAEAGDGDGLVETIARVRPDVVIIDYALPLVDGIEITRRIRRLPDDKLRSVGVLLLAANTTAELVTEARNGGVDEFLCKPFSADGFQKRLCAAVFHRREFINVETYVGPCRRRFVNPLFEGDDRRDREDLLRLPSAIKRLIRVQQAG